MYCLLTTLILLFPRLVILIWWLIQPLRWQVSFNTWIWPLLGAIFIPWTTLSYMIVSPGGVVGFEWVWISLAVIVDIASAFGSGTANRRQSANMDEGARLDELDFS